MLLENGMMIWNWIGLVEGDLLMRLNRMHSFAMGVLFRLNRIQSLEMGVLLRLNRMHSLAMLSLILLNRIPSFDTNQPNLVYPYRNH